MFKQFPCTCKNHEPHTFITLCLLDYNSFQLVIRDKRINHMYNNSQLNNSQENFKTSYVGITADLRQ